MEETVTELFVCVPLVPLWFPGLWFPDCKLHGWSVFASRAQFE